MIELIQDHAVNYSIDDQAVLRAAQQDVRAFEPLYDAYVDRIYGYCLRRVNSTQDAEDLTSLVFAEAIDGLQAYRGGSVAAWLFQIADRTVKKHWRSQREALPLDDYELTLTDDGPSPMQQLLALEQRDILNRAVMRLSDEQRNILALKLSAGLSSEEIGSVIGKSAGAVRVDVYRALKQLRTLYHLEEGKS